VRKLLIAFLLPKIVDVIRRRYGRAPTARHRSF
jgi:hypothetical protein